MSWYSVSVWLCTLTGSSVALKIFASLHTGQPKDSQKSSSEPEANVHSSRNKPRVRRTRGSTPQPRYPQRLRQTPTYYQPIIVHWAEYGTYSYPKGNCVASMTKLLIYFIPCIVRTCILCLINVSVINLVYSVPWCHVCMFIHLYLICSLDSCLFQLLVLYPLCCVLTLYAFMTQLTLGHPFSHPFTPSL